MKSLFNPLFDVNTETGATAWENEMKAKMKIEMKNLMDGGLAWVESWSKNVKIKWKRGMKKFQMQRNKWETIY